MAEVQVHFDIRFGKRLVHWGLAGLMLTLCAPELGSENVTLTTYYPAPSGVYEKMIVTGDTFLATLGGTSRNVGIRTTSTGTDALRVNGNATFYGGRVSIGNTSFPAGSYIYLEVGSGNVGTIKLRHRESYCVSRTANYGSVTNCPGSSRYATMITGIYTNWQGGPANDGGKFLCCSCGGNCSGL